MTVSSSSHAVNLLGNLPLPCLDVLLMPKVHHGCVEYMGVNMDAVNMLLEFVEKRLDRVRGNTYYLSKNMSCYWQLIII